MLECEKSNQPAGRQGFTGANVGIIQKSQISNLKSSILNQCYNATMLKCYNATMVMLE
jgi:hypothetical protein